jgi:hypothetical protein
MDHFAGLDVSVKETSVCIVDAIGKIVREVKVAREPAALLAVLKNPAYRIKRIGLEAGPLPQWLFSAPPKRSCRWFAFRRAVERLQAKPSRAIQSRIFVEAMAFWGL